MLKFTNIPRARARVVENKSPILGLALFVNLVGLLVFIASLSIHPAIAASSTYLNFQARLLTSSGAVVADGDYNIEFKVFNASSSSGSSQGSCSGDANCLWVETRTGGNKARVVNGYLSVNLGSVTAFASTINWDQQHWLTMNIGGTGSPSWDGEMSPRILLTALPYSFSSGEVATSSGANRGKLSFGSVTNNPVITLPNETGTVCTTGSVCTGYQAAGNYFVNGGNSFSGAATLGTNDSNSLSFETAGNTQATIAVGGATTFKNSADSTTAFQIQNAATTALFVVDSSNSRIYVGNPTGDTVGALLVVDNKTDAGDPTGVEGGIYYNASTDKFRCFQASTWADCISGTATTLQSAYDNDADGSDAVIQLSTGDDSIILRNPASSGSDSTYVLTLDQLSTGARGGLDVQSAGTGNLVKVTDTTATARDVFTIADGGGHHLP